MTGNIRSVQLCMLIGIIWGYSSLYPNPLPVPIPRSSLDLKDGDLWSFLVTIHGRNTPSTLPKVPVIDLIRNP